jgi:CRISPR-associated protein Cmr2
MTQYLGLTIGPIIETMQLTSTPAGLWAASYLFSELSHQLCKRLKESGATVITPYYYEEAQKNTGLGLFPDRIICRRGAMTLDALKPLIDQARDDIAQLLCKEGDDSTQMKDYLRDYLQVHAIFFETDKNPIAYSKSFLAAAELEHRFCSCEGESPLLNFLEYREKNELNRKNEAIKKSKLVKVLGEAWPLWASSQNGEIRSLAHIASNGHVSDPKLMKKHFYYAVVQADGDNIGNAICALDADKINGFSEQCWKYSTEAAQIVRKYGGVPIYVGGDDLLAIVPVENASGANVFSLLSDLRNAFYQVFKEEGKTPTLSFGVSIQYYKFPLYESFAQAYALLQKAKKRNNNEKNAIALRLQKHSGQSVGILFPGGRSVLLAKLCEQIDELTKKKSNETQLLLHSIMAHLRLQESVFAEALDCGAAENAFTNVFRAIPSDILEQARTLTELCSDKNVQLLEEQEGHDQRLLAADSLLRLQKFFVEPGKEDNRA